jgi:molecular chaperone GrpE
MNEEKKDLEGLNEDSARGDNSRDEPDRVSAEESTGAADAGPGEEAGTAGGEAVEENDPAVLRKLLAEQTTRADENYDRLIRLQADYIILDDGLARKRRRSINILLKSWSARCCRFWTTLICACGGRQFFGKFQVRVQMIYKQLLDVLAAEGVAQIPALGEQFDPLKHEAVLRAESDETPITPLLKSYGGATI